MLSSDVCFVRNEFMFTFYYLRAIYVLWSSLPCCTGQLTQLNGDKRPTVIFLIANYKYIFF